MIVMTKCNICLNTEYKKVISPDDIYFVKTENQDIYKEAEDEDSN